MCGLFSEGKPEVCKKGKTRHGPALNPQGPCYGMGTEYSGATRWAVAQHISHSGLLEVREFVAPLSEERSMLPKQEMCPCSQIVTSQV